MRVILLKQARIRHESGEIVNVSPEEANFLLSVGIAKPVNEGKQGMYETPETPKKKVTRKK